MHLSSHELFELYTLVSGNEVRSAKIGVNVMPKDVA